MTDRSQEAVSSDQATATAVTVGTSAASAAAARNSRICLKIANLGAATVYFGTTSAVTTATGIPIAANGSHTEEFYTGAVYMVSGTAGQDVRLWEVG